MQKKQIQVAKRNLKVWSILINETAMDYACVWLLIRWVNKLRLGKWAAPLKKYLAVIGAWSTKS